MRTDRASGCVQLFDLVFLFGLLLALPLAIVSFLLAAAVAAVTGHGDRAAAYLVWAVYSVCLVPVLMPAGMITWLGLSSVAHRVFVRQDPETDQGAPTRPRRTFGDLVGLAYQGWMVLGAAMLLVMIAILAVALLIDPL